MEVLILTNSYDGSSDVISKILAKKKIHFIRWNIDFWDKYEITFRDGYFEIIDPLKKKISSKNNLKVLWRKPFTDYFDLNVNKSLSKNDTLFAKNEIKSILNTVLSFTRKNKKIFIDPIDEFRTPKLFQLKLAKKYFKLPNYEFSIIKHYTDIGNSIIKPLGNSEVGKKILYTTKIKQNQILRPYPWFFQEAIEDGKDVTCVYIKDNMFFFECDFKRNSNSIDWRIEINKANQSKWHQHEDKSLSSLKNNIKKFMKKLGLNYGRIDFIKKNGIYFFLECNPNGQFGWLDNMKTLKLHNCFVKSFLKFN